MEITRKSVLTGQTHTLDINITEDQLMSWYHGANIQDVMPEIEPSLREFIMTGITPAEWDAYMKEEPDCYPDDASY